MVFRDFTRIVETGPSENMRQFSPKHRFTIYRHIELVGCVGDWEGKGLIEVR